MTDIYLSTEDFKDYLNLAALDDTTVPTLTQVQKYISMAEEDVEKQIGIFRTTSQTSIVRGNAMGVYTPSIPIQSVTSIALSNGDNITPTFSLIPMTDIRISNKESGRVLLRSPFVGREYEITYISGYSYEEVPEKLKYITFLYTMAYLFDIYVFDTQGGASSKSEIIDVGTYKEVTKSSAYNGKSALKGLIQDQKTLFQGKFKVSVGYIR